MQIQVISFQTLRFTSKLHTFSCFTVLKEDNNIHAGIFLAILGRGPRAFLIGKIRGINPGFGKISEHSKLIIDSMLANVIQ